MYGLKELTRIFKNADVYSFDDDSKLVFLSDCHRGDGSWADTFMKNRNICLGALNFYYQQGFTYMELGDGDELWENKSLSSIVNTHKDIYRMLKLFFDDARLYVLYGNHDMKKRSAKYVRRNLQRYFDTAEKKCLPLFSDIRVYDGIVLRYAPASSDILLVHGHQVDFLNSALWRLTGFLVRHVWRPLEIFGVNDPTSTAKNNSRKASVEKKLIFWAQANHKMLISGHTHRPAFPEIGEAPYFNDGSCVHPGCITALEIADGCITLVKWCVKLKQDGTLYVGREEMAGPERLVNFFTAHFAGNVIKSKTPRYR